MLIRLLRLRHPPSSEYAHWSSSLDVPGIEKEGRFQRISSFFRQKNNEIQKGFALRAPTPWTNISLYTCNGICKQRKAGWTRKAARRRQTEGGFWDLFLLPSLSTSSLVRRQDSKPRSDSSIDESMPRNLAKEKETMATRLRLQGRGPNSLVRTLPTRRSSSLIPKSQATILLSFLL